MEPPQTFFFDQAQCSWQRDPNVTFLCMAARFGDVVTLKKLLQETLSSDRHFLTSPAVGLILKRATQAGQVEVLQCLVEAGININTPFKGASALHEAVKMDNVDMLKYLLTVSGVRCNMLSTAHKTPLMEAACRARVECIKALLEAGCKVQDSNERGRNAVHYCLLPAIGTLDADDMTACLDSLFAHGADVDAGDVDGCTPLHVAIETENVEAVLWLLRRNCQLNVEARPPHLAPGVLSCLEHGVAMTPLLLAVHFSNRRMVELLVSCGADYSRLGWVLAYCSGYELLHQFLTRCLNTPPSLQTFCRQVIRRAVGHGLEVRVQSLAIPGSIQRYLLLTDELSSP